MVAILRRMAKAVLPRRFIHWYRRRRAVRRLLNALGHELYDRKVQVDVDNLEGRVAARRDGFYQQLVKDVLDRTDLVLQELHKRIEGATARHGDELAAVRSELSSLRASLETMLARLEATEGSARPADARAGARPSSD